METPELNHQRSKSADIQSLNATSASDLAPTISPQSVTELTDRLGAGPTLPWNPHPPTAYLQPNNAGPGDVRRRSADPAIPVWPNQGVIMTSNTTGVASARPPAPPNWPPHGYLANGVPVPYPMMPYGPTQGWPQRPPYMGQPYPQQYAGYNLANNRQASPQVPPPPPPITKSNSTADKERENMMIRARLKGLDRSVIENSTAIKGNNTTQTNSTSHQQRVAAGPAPTYQQSQWQSPYPNPHSMPARPALQQRVPPPPPSPNQIPIMPYSSQMYSGSYGHPPSPNAVMPPSPSSSMHQPPPSPLLDPSQKNLNRLSVSSISSLGGDFSGSAPNALSDWYLRSMQFPSAPSHPQYQRSPTSPAMPQFPLPGVPHHEDSRKLTAGARGPSRPMSVVFMSEPKADNFLPERSTNVSANFPAMNEEDGTALSNIVLLVRSPSGRRASTPAALSMERGRRVERKEELQGVDQSLKVVSNVPVPALEVDDTVTIHEANPGNVDPAKTEPQGTFEEKEIGFDTRSFDASPSISPSLPAPVESTATMDTDEYDNISMPPPAPHPYTNLDRPLSVSSLRSRLSDPELSSLSRFSRFGSITSSAYDTYERFLYLGITGRPDGTLDHPSSLQRTAGLARTEEVSLPRYPSVRSHGVVDRNSTLASSQVAFDTYERFLRYGVTGTHVGTPIQRPINGGEEVAESPPDHLNRTPSMRSTSSHRRRSLSDPDILSSISRYPSIRSFGVMDRKSSVSSSRFDTFDRFLHFGVTGQRVGTPVNGTMTSRAPATVEDCEDEIADAPPPAPRPFVSLDRPSSASSSLRRRLSDPDVGSLYRPPSIRSHGNLDRQGSLSSTRFDTFDRFLHFGVTGQPVATPVHTTFGSRGLLSTTSSHLSSVQDDGIVPPAPRPFLLRDPTSSTSLTSDTSSIRYPRSHGNLDRNASVSSSRFDTFDRFLHFGVTGHRVGTPMQNVFPRGGDASDEDVMPPAPRYVFLDDRSSMRRRSDTSLSRRVSMQSQRRGVSLDRMDTTERGDGFVGPAVVVLDAGVVEEVRRTYGATSPEAVGGVLIDAGRLAEVVQRRVSGRGHGRGRARWRGDADEGSKDEGGKDGGEFAMVLDRGETEMVLGMGEELNKRENASSIPFVDEGNVETETVEHDIVVVMPQEPLKDESHYTSISSLISDTSTARPISSPSVSTPSTPKPVLARVRSRIRRFVQPRTPPPPPKAASATTTTPPNPNKGHRRTVSSSSQKSSTSTSSPKLSIAKRSASPSPPTPAVDGNGRRPSLTDVSVEDGKEKRRVGVRNDRSSSVASSLTGLGAEVGEEEPRKSVGERHHHSLLGLGKLGGGAATGSTGEKVGSSGTSTKEGGGVRKMFGFWGH